MMLNVKYALVPACALWVASSAFAEEKKDPKAPAATPAASPAAAAEPATPPAPPAPPAPPPKPKDRTLEVAHESGSGKFSFSFHFLPGVPDPDTTVELTIGAAQVPQKPHPRFGNRVPIEDGRMVVDLLNPAGQVVGRYLAHPVPMAAGRYALHMTPSQKGIHSVSVHLTTADDKEVRVDAKFPVDVWPLPDDLKAEDAKNLAQGERRPVKK